MDEFVDLRGINEEKSENELDFHKCPECSSDTNLVKWNNRKRPCPKCNGKMEKDSNGEMILWD